MSGLKATITYVVVVAVGNGVAAGGRLVAASWEPPVCHPSTVAIPATIMVTLAEF